jgi:hypothetical protein
MADATLSLMKATQHIDGLLTKEGWGIVPLTEAPATRLYYRRVDGLVLLMALETSRRDRTRFTGSFYLGRSFTWSYAVDDFPRDAYRRIGHFIQGTERADLGLPQAANEAVEAWWTGFSEENLDGLARAIAVGFPRFLSQTEIADRVLQSRVLSEHARLLASVQRAVAEQRGIDEPPGVKHDGAVPLSWYRAASQVARDEGNVWHNKDGVKFIAEDAWCCERL